MILADKLTAYENDGMLPVTVPDIARDNLAAPISLRPYQERAISRFVWLTEPTRREENGHLLFHMATGSGKTVIMAAVMLHLYEQGYRDFLFFVNSSQIVEKTRANFVDAASAKHLFAPTIRIDDRIVPLRAVDNFDASDDAAINIVFTTIQGLHSTLQNPRENSVSYEDFKDRRVVLIADEAHHVNALTKKPSKSEQEEEKRWEHTVRKLHGSDPANILLEFSATVDMGKAAIAAKYGDKLVMDYPLRAFRADGYSKDIFLRKADLPVEDRMLQAIVISEHRRAVARDTLRQDWKPVVMMKSGTVAQSNANEAAFHTLIASLDAVRLVTLETTARGPKGDTHLAAAFDVLVPDGNHDDLARSLQSEFGEARVTNVNKPDDLGAQQILLNSLEEPSNPIRCIFAVEKLDEGWDVLNLFDIVRLSDKGGTGKKPTATTMREAQLIGRGARYFPFADPHDAGAVRNKRKFDADHTSPLRLLEQMHYHCTNEVKYISDLRKALIETGALEDDEATVELKLKPEFRDHRVFKNYSFFRNARVPIDKSARSINDVLETRHFGVELPPAPTGRAVEVGAFDAAAENAAAHDGKPGSRDYTLADLGLPVLRRACDANPLLRFDALRRSLPRLASLSAFLTSDEFAGAVAITVRGRLDRVHPLSPADALHVAEDVLGSIAIEVSHHGGTTTGSTAFHPVKISSILKDRTIKLTVPGETMRSWQKSEVPGTDGFSLRDCQWHVFDDC